MEPQQAEPDSKLAKVIMIGDSLTKYSFFLQNDLGLGPQLQIRLKDRATVIDEGYPGYTTLMILPVVTKLCQTEIKPANPPALVTLWLGTNDSAKFPGHVPLAKYVSNMRSLIRILLGRGVERVLVITPPPMDVPTCSKKKADSLKDGEEWDLAGVIASAGKLEYAAAVLDLVRTLRAEVGDENVSDRLAVADVWRGMTNAALRDHGQKEIPEDVELRKELLKEYMCLSCGLPGVKKFPDDWFTDYLHLGPGGYKVVNEVVFGAIDTAWPGFLLAAEAQAEAKVEA